MIGREITTARKKLGLTQRQFARVVGVTQPTLATWETNAKEPSQMAQRFIGLIATLQPAADWVRLHAE
jgi:DNA-binding transcriptional regulator YiaG